MCNGVQHGKQKYRVIQVNKSLVQVVCISYHVNTFLCPVFRDQAQQAMLFIMK